MARAMSTSIFTGSASWKSSRATTGPKFELLNRVQLMFKVWKERHDLADLDTAALRDLGLTKSEVANEISRSPLDVPRHRC